MLTYTRFGKYEYFSLRSQVPDTGYCTYVVEEKGMKTLKQAAGEEFGVFAVYVTCRTENLLARGISPERIARDNHRPQMDYALIDVVLGNNATEEEFFKGAEQLMEILEQWRHLH